MNAPLNLAELRPGFSEPVRDSQSVFRSLLTATAQPGTRAELGKALTPPVGLNQAAAAVLLTLADQDTLVWFEPSLRGGAIESWLRFHTSCPLTDRTEEAAFAVVSHTGLAPQLLSGFNQGDAKYPDLATTVIVMVPDLEAGPNLVLEGPGIETIAEIAPQGLPDSFWSERAELVAHFQFGIDVMLCAEATLISIPRTTRIQSKGE